MFQIETLFRLDKQTNKIILDDLLKEGKKNTNAKQNKCALKVVCCWRL
jgi:hypothetical protein